MVYVALDHFLAGVPLPDRPPEDWLPRLWRRLVASWDLPFGVLQYFDWQRRADLGPLTLREWDGVRAGLDAGSPVPLGLVQAAGWNPRRMPLHHQVLATGYRLVGGAAELSVYDPNWPNDDDRTLTVDLATGGVADPAVRGLFRTEYRRADPCDVSNGPSPDPAGPGVGQPGHCPSPPCCFRM
jgi:hypothetical protein